MAEQQRKPLSKEAIMDAIWSEFPIEDRSRAAGFNEREQCWMDVAATVVATLSRKNIMYGDSYARADTMEEVVAENAVRLGDKMARLKKMANDAMRDIERDHGDEALEDTLCDIAGYAILLLGLRSGKLKVGGQDPTAFKSVVDGTHLEVSEPWGPDVVSGPEMKPVCVTCQTELDVTANWCINCRTDPRTGEPGPGRWKCICGETRIQDEPCFKCARSIRVTADEGVVVDGKPYPPDPMPPERVTHPERLDQRLEYWCTACNVKLEALGHCPTCDSPDAVVGCRGYEPADEEPVIVLRANDEGYAEALEAHAVNQRCPKCSTTYVGKQVGAKREWIHWCPRCDVADAPCQPVVDKRRYEEGGPVPPEPVVEIGGPVTIIDGDQRLSWMEGEVTQALHDRLIALGWVPPTTEAADTPCIGCGEPKGGPPDGLCDECRDPERPATNESTSMRGLPPRPCNLSGKPVAECDCNVCRYIQQSGHGYHL